jgi:hypothetical protein
MLGMPEVSSSRLGSFWSEASGVAKAAIAAGVAAAVLGGGFFLFNGDSAADSKRNANSQGSATSVQATLPGAIIGGGGWSTNWGASEPTNKGKQISIYRPTTALTDYRMEFRGQIERKALGWVFRAQDPKNYYVYKIEIIKPGLEPVLALVKYSVINGHENTHTQVILPQGYRLDELFRVRMDVRGSKITTYVQDKLVDYWTDDKIKTGGAGFYNDSGERAQIRSSQISYLSASSK